jgi:hypothetical protein
MHGTCTGPSLSERGCELPCMRQPLWTLWRLQQLRDVLVPVLLLFWEQWGRPEQRRRVQQQRKASLVASRIVSGLHAYRGAGTYAGPQQRREPSEAA